MDPFSEPEQAALDRLVDAYYARHGAAIDLIKSEVGDDGEEFENSVARAVVSPRGAWCEVTELPVEFSGVVSPDTSHHFVGDAQAAMLVSGIRQLTLAEPSEPLALLDVLALYSLSGLLDHQDVFLWRAPGPGDQSDRPRTVGVLRDDVLPLFMRARLTGNRRVPGLSLERGVVVFLADVGDLHVVIELPHEGGAVHDLGAGTRLSSPQ